MNAVEVLQKYWGYGSFRPLQEEIVEAVLAHESVLALLPTGGGKSICFQVPALMLKGICIVISPLIALMQDQIDQLQRRGIKAAAIFSGMSKRQIDITLDNCLYGNVKFLYVSPERLKSDLFLERSAQMDISLLAVDEAHCISQWGYDFRPPYLDIANFKNHLKIRKVIALTATATKEVKEDIVAKLEMDGAKQFQKSFARENLSYSVFNLENKEGKMLQILNSVKGSSVVYVRSRKKTKEISDFLRKHGISASFYHGGLETEVRAETQERWIKGEFRVIAATNAFGMGIDKSDVRTVIHLDLPDTMEAYYQEAGRAGRDGKKAYAILAYHPTDIDRLKQRIEQSHVTPQQIRRVYQALCNYFKFAIGS
ncbi:MAG: ATP-dependent DNA helicase RecQ, partial [Bacteroidota bacterium]